MPCEFYVFRGVHLQPHSCVAIAGKATKCGASEEGRSKLRAQERAETQPQPLSFVSPYNENF